MYKEIKFKDEIECGNDYLIMYKDIPSYSGIYSLGEIYLYSKNILDNIYIQYRIIRHPGCEGCNCLTSFQFERNVLKPSLKNRIFKTCKGETIKYKIESKEDIEEIVNKQMMLIELRK